MQEVQRLIVDGVVTAWFGGSSLQSGGERTAFLAVLPGDQPPKQALDLTGAAILVFRDTRSCRRPRQVSLVVLRGAFMLRRYVRRNSAVSFKEPSMFSVRLPCLSAASVLFAIATPTAQAQPSFYTAMSVEAMALNADALVIGVVVGVSEEKKFNVATIAVEETLRGKHQARQQVRFPDNIWQLGVGAYNAKDLRKIQDDAPRLLVAMRGEPAEVCGLVYLAEQNFAEQNMRRGSADEVYKADLTTLQKPADLLRVVKETLRNSPGVKCIDTFPLTVPIKGGYYGRGGSTTVEVPVDESLEKKAVQYLGSKERWRRTEGAAALKYFKSEQTIARLKELLSDAEPLILSAESNFGVEVRFYTVRKAAFETLKYWGIAVKEPVVEEKIKRRAP
jgi:hypothetical protein